MLTPGGRLTTIFLVEGASRTLGSTSDSGSFSRRKLYPAGEEAFLSLSVPSEEDLKWRLEQPWSCAGSPPASLLAWAETSAGCCQALALTLTESGPAQRAGRLT